MGENKSDMAHYNKADQKKINIIYENIDCSGPTVKSQPLMIQIKDKDIVFKNEEFLVINKPSGISVHNQEDSENLISLVSHFLGCEQLYPPHRLDKDTSGLQILCLNPKSAQTLSHLFSQRQIEKKYIGVVAGKLETSGVWRQEISDKAEGAKNPQGLTKDRVSAETHYRVLDVSPFFSLVEFEIKTGRQHQIRKHCLLNGHVLIGDPRYGKPNYNQKIEQIYSFRRLALHSKSLKWNQYELTSEAPIEFLNLLKVPKK